MFNTGDVMRGYVAALLWTEGLDRDGYAAGDLTVDSLNGIREQIESTLATVEEEHPETFDRMDAEQFGHDFWLTRNGEGAGFWDRDLGELGDWLTALVKPYGESYVYVERGEVYVEQ
jgi:hypothetical protein